MKLFIVANWKMNPLTLTEARRLFSSVKNGLKDIKNAEIVICPPFLFILNLKSKIHAPYRNEVSGTELNLKLGAQDCFWEQTGAFTGEVSPVMLKNSGVKYVILGHSERRKYQNETYEMINKKIKTALKSGLKPILCVDNVLQARRGLEGIPKEELKAVVIAYEPLFAIGSGKPCSPQEAEKMRILIKKAVNTDIPILYGGSVNSQNATDYIEKAGFQGLLIGGASLNHKEFINLVKNVGA